MIPDQISAAEDFTFTLDIPSDKVNALSVALQESIRKYLDLLKKCSFIKGKGSAASRCN